MRDSDDSGHLKFFTETPDYIWKQPAIYSQIWGNVLKEPTKEGYQTKVYNCPVSELVFLKSDT